MRALAAILALTCLVGCESVTEIFVVVQSDLDVPSDIDAVSVQVSGAATMTATGTLEGTRAVPLPRTLGVVRSGGRTGPVRVVVTGTRRGLEVVRRSATTSFSPGRTLILPIVLTRACVGRNCVVGQTCEGGACVSDEISPTVLEEYAGRLPPFDAGFCPQETCDGEDNDCDGRTDEGFMLDTNPRSCGECGRVCLLPNASSGCAGGECTIAACDSGAMDCNADATDGCELSIRTLTDCGACGVPCAVTGATATCVTGTCLVETCDAGLGDCNTDLADGCETPTNTLTNCGGCGVPCAVADGTPSCDTGTCAVASCDMFFEDCNMDAMDGCEANTRFDEMACGDCMTQCAPTEMCINGMCQ